MDRVANVIWAGDRYRVVWDVPTAGAHALNYRDIINGSLSPVGVLAPSVSAEFDRRNLPSLCR